MKKTIYFLLATCLMFSLVSVGMADSAWLHINVDNDEDQININLPIALAETVVWIVDFGDKPTVIKVDDHEITVPEMRKIWEVLKSEGSFTLASIKSGKKGEGDNIDIAFENNRLLITGTTDDSEIDINISGNLIDALFSGEVDKLNLEACLAELKLKGVAAGYVNIRGDEGEKVRLWVDNNKSADK
ncbi:MAG: hypothetical protein ABIJ42_00625 [Acidobacteriota bacterium]